jgi:hypothetical protein
MDGGIFTVAGTGLPVREGSSQGLSVRSHGGGFPTWWSFSIPRILSELVEEGYVLRERERPTKSLPGS